MVFICFALCAYATNPYICRNTVRRVARKPDCGVSNMNFIKKYVMKNRLVSIIMLWILATCACLAGKRRALWWLT